MPPLRMNRSVQSTNHTNDNRTNVTINETSTKTFFLIFQSETCCKLTLVTRYYSGKVSCHAIELLIDYEHRCLTTCNSIQVQSVKLLYVVFFFFSIESFYIEWNCFWMTVYKTSNKFLKMSANFEYFSINKQYTSRRR